MPCGETYDGLHGLCKFLVSSVYILCVRIRRGQVQGKNAINLFMLQTHIYSLQSTDIDHEWWFYVGIFWEGYDIYDFYANEFFFRKSIYCH